MRAATVCVLAVVGCGGAPEAPLPYASEVISFSPGEGAGFGKEAMPGVVLGPPRGKGLSAASTHVVSLGVGGEITVGFGSSVVVDGPGPDLVVFENVFLAGGDPPQPFAEPGEVSVSSDGVEWATFDCDPTGPAGEGWAGCAGWHPTLVYDAAALVPIDAELAGGDAFDLAALGVGEVRYVRITDRSDGGAAPNAGFDLDAVGAIHLDGD